MSLRSNHALVEDIRLGNSKQFRLEPLKELLKLLPEEEEVKKIKNNNNSHLLLKSPGSCNSVNE